jgi:MFS family permease
MRRPNAARLFQHHFLSAGQQLSAVKSGASSEATKSVEDPNPAESDEGPGRQQRGWTKTGSRALSFHSLNPCQGNAARVALALAWLGSVKQAPNEPPAKSTIWPLLSLNFFMADMQAGIGPFLGVFLLAHGWESGLIGTVMTVGGVAGMLMTTPAGALIDATRRKRLYVIIPGICTVIGSGIVLLSQSFWLVTLSQVATAIAGAAIGPAVSGMTLGIVRQAGFIRQNGHNQAFNHAGNMVGAGLSGLLGWVINRWGVYPVQVLDGIGAGLQSVAVPGLVARILDRTGRVNVGQGAVMTVQGLGASISPAIGGWIAQEIGYSAMFLILGSFALGSIALWLGFASLLKPACARHDYSRDRRTVTALAGAQ